MYNHGAGRRSRYGRGHVRTGIRQRNEAAEKRTAPAAGHHRHYPVRRNICDLSGGQGHPVSRCGDLSGAVQPAPLAHCHQKQPVHDPGLHHLLHGGGIPVRLCHRPPGCALQGAVPLYHAAAHRLTALYRGAELYPALRRSGDHHKGPAGTPCGHLWPPGTVDRPDRHLLPLRLLGDLRRHEGDLHQSGVRGL